MGSANLTLTYTSLTLSPITTCPYTSSILSGHDSRWMYLFTNNDTLSIHTTDSTFASVYNLQWRFSITNNTSSYFDYDIQVTLVDPCSYSNQTISLLPSTIGNQVYEIGSSNLSLSVAQIILSPLTTCLTSNTISGIDLSIMYQHTSNDTLTIYTTDRVLNADSYTISWRFSIVNNAFNYFDYSFTITLVDPCTYSNQTLTLNPASIAAQSYGIGMSNLTLTFTSVTTAPVASCTYLSTITGFDSSFMDSPTEDSLTIFSTDTGKAGNYPITWRLYILNNTAVYTEVSFNLNLFVPNPCQFSNQTISVTPSFVNVSTIDYAIGNTNLTLSLTSVTTAPQASCSYESVITGLDASFMAFSNATDTITLQTNDINKENVYSITWRIQIVGNTAIYQEYTFTIDVKNPCLFSNQTISVTQSIPGVVSYSVGSSALGLTLTSVTTSALYMLCPYSNQITVFNNSFMSIDQSTNTLTIFTNDLTINGSYSISWRIEITNNTGIFYQISFTLDIISPCLSNSQSITVVPSAIATQNYQIGDPGINLILNSVITAPQAFCPYESIITGLNPSLMQFYPNNDTLRIYSTTSIGNASFPITWTIQIVNNTAKSQAITFTIDVTTPSININCKITPAYIMNQTYIIGEDQLNIPYSSFSKNADCGSFSISFSGTINSQAIPTSLIAINNTASQLQVQTNTPNSKGNYSVVLTGSINSGNWLFKGESKFNLEVLRENFNAPQFKGALIKVIIQPDQTITYDLPDIEDLDGDDYEIQVKLNDAKSFVKFQKSTFYIMPSQNNLGSYQIEIVLKDIHQYPLQKAYTLNVEVKNLVVTTKAIKDKAAEGLSAKISSISPTGVVKVEFSSSLIVPDYSQIGQQDLVITVNSGEGESSEDLTVRWNITKFTDREMELRLYFNKPIQISSSLKDQLNVIFASNGFFLQASTNLPITYMFSTQKDIPKQAKSQKEAALLSSLGEYAAVAVGSFVIANFVLNTVLASSLTYLWGMVNALQLLVHLPLFNIDFPANVKLLFSMMIGLAQFQILPTSDAESTIFYSLCGFTAASAFVLLIYLPCSRINKYEFQALTKTINRMKVILGKIMNVFFFNLYFRYLFESYIELTFASMLNLNVANFDTFSLYVSAVFSLIILIATLILPILVTLLLLLMKSSLHEEEVEARMGSLYEGVKIEQTSALFTNVIFLGRRLMFSAAIVYLQNHPFFQIQFMLYTGILMIFYILYVKPYKEPEQNYLEIFNEGCVLAMSYCMVLLTDFMPDAELQYEIGYVVIGITGLNLLGNNVLIFIKMIRNLKLSFRKLKYKYQMWRRRRNQSKQSDRVKKYEAPYEMSPADEMANSMVSRNSSIDVTRHQSNLDIPPFTKITVHPTQVEDTSVLGGISSPDLPKQKFQQQDEKFMEQFIGESNAMSKPEKRMQKPRRHTQIPGYQPLKNSRNHINNLLQLKPQPQVDPQENQIPQIEEIPQKHEEEKITENPVSKKAAIRKRKMSKLLAEHIRQAELMEQEENNQLVHHRFLRGFY